MKPDKGLLFRHIPSGLYFHITSNQYVVLINKVFEKRGGLYQKKCDGTNQARRELTMVGYSSDKDFKNMVRSRMITKFLITLDGINNANKIFGPDVPSLKGKTVRGKPKPVVSNYIKTLKEILQLHKMV